MGRGWPPVDQALPVPGLAFVLFPRLANHHCQNRGSAMHESSDSPSASAVIADLAIPHQASVTTAPDGGYPVQWQGRQAVVTLPGHIDASNASRIGEELRSLINGGATELIADMSATGSCDYSGADAMVHVHRHALINGTQMRLVVTAQIVQRVIALNGLDRLVPVYPFRAAALRPGASSGGPGDTQAGARMRRNLET
jgi:anti-sigma B factor antagonist